MNGGEQLVSGYSVDGYIQIPSGGGEEPYQIVFEYMGCFYHACPNHCQESIQTQSAIERDCKRLYEIEQCVDKLVVMRSCIWYELRKTVTFSSKLSCFLGTKCVKEKEILEAVENNNFFGIVKLDMKTPKNIQEKYKNLNFPFIFAKTDVTESMLSPSTLKTAKLLGREFPHSCLTMRHNKNKIILATPLLKFYLSLGMEASNIEWALEYLADEKPFEGYVKEMVKVRIASVGVNEPLGARAKFTLNSSAGRMGMNIERHRNTKYVFEKNLHRYNRTPLLEKETKLVTEYDINVFEVISKKRVNTDSIPVHISLFIYQMSKLWLYQFILVLFEYLKPNSFTLAYIGKICNWLLKVHIRNNIYLLSYSY